MPELFILQKTRPVACCRGKRLLTQRCKASFCIPVGGGSTIFLLSFIIEISVITDQFLMVRPASREARGGPFPV